MFSLTTLILIAALSLAVGGLAGALLMRLSPAGQHNRDLEERLRQSEARLERYQEEVAEHFAETSRRVNQLTHSYREVHQHLANGALKLTNPDISRRILDASHGRLPEADSDDSPAEEPAGQAPEPPRDWAPKSPGQAGALSESYGLDEDNETDEKETRAKPADT